jgi:hypothetical protein
MNVVERTAAQSASFARGATFTTEPLRSGFTSTVAGYSAAEPWVNASDRPQADGGQDSSGAPTAAADAQAQGGQKARFRAELLLPYGHLFA